MLRRPWPPMKAVRFWLSKRTNSWAEQLLFQAAASGCPTTTSWPRPAFPIRRKQHSPTSNVLSMAEPLIPNSSRFSSTPHLRCSSTSWSTPRPRSTFNLSPTTTHHGDGKAIFPVRVAPWKPTPIPSANACRSGKTRSSSAARSCHSGQRPRSPKISCPELQRSKRNLLVAKPRTSAQRAQLLSQHFSRACLTAALTFGCPRRQRISSSTNLALWWAQLLNTMAIAHVSVHGRASFLPAAVSNGTERWS